MDSKQSRWRSQKNGLPQGSVLVPTLFNFYTNDLPTFADIRRFIYANDLCLVTQGKRFEEIERRLSSALKTLSCYYQKWFLNPNPGKTKVCCFHLNNRNVARTLKIQWEGKEVDRILLFQSHIDKLLKKISPRNNLIGILANSSWGADPHMLRTTLLALCYSTAEYWAAVWCRSAHARRVNVELNKACRTITGTLKITTLPALQTERYIST